MKENNYPKDFLQNCLKPVHPYHKTTENDSSMMGFVVVPNIHGVTEPIKRILCSYNAKVAQKPFLTLKYIFAKPKDPVPKEQKSDAIYSIPCNDCNQEYIGFTGDWKNGNETYHSISFTDNLNKADRNYTNENIVPFNQHENFNVGNFPIVKLPGN